MSKAAFGLLWCFVFVIPWDEFVELPLLGSVPHLVGVAASAVGVLYILARQRVRPLSWFHMLAIAFVLWAGATSFWSIDPEATHIRLSTYLQLAVLVWLVWEIGWSPERRRALLQAYVLGASVAAIAAIHGYLYGSFNGEQARFTSLSLNENQLGLTLVLGLPMAWYLSLSHPRGRIAWRWQLYIPLGVTAILLTASRGAFLAALVALVIIPWTLAGVRLRAKAALYALVVGSLVFATSAVPAASLERLRGTRADIAAGNFGGRGIIWKAGLQVVREHPLAGVGAGAFGAAVEPTLRDRWSPHQTFLAILVEEGIVGLLLFLTMVAAAMKPLRHWPALQRRFWIVMLAALAVGGLSGAWDYRKQFWFVLGLLAAEGTLGPGRRASSRAVVTRASCGMRSAVEHSWNG